MIRNEQSCTVRQEALYFTLQWQAFYRKLFLILTQRLLLPRDWGNRLHTRESTSSSTQLLQSGTQEGEQSYFQSHPTLSMGEHASKPGHTLNGEQVRNKLWLLHLCYWITLPQEQDSQRSNINIYMSWHLSDFFYGSFKSGQLNEGWQTVDRCPH